MRAAEFLTAIKKYFEKKFVFTQKIVSFFL